MPETDGANIADMARVIWENRFYEAKIRDTFTPELSEFMEWEVSQVALVE
jgi:hypothetical protein